MHEITEFTWFTETNIPRQMQNTKKHQRNLSIVSHQLTFHHFKGTVSFFLPHATKGFRTVLLQ